MKTSKYYRLDEKVGGMRGGKTQTKNSGPGKFKQKLKKWGHSISSKF